MAEMDMKEKLVELKKVLRDCLHFNYDEFSCDMSLDVDLTSENLIAHGVTVQECARPIEEWGEDYGDVLWWKFPIEEPPYVGSPLDEKWPAYHTHWTQIVMPQPPKGE